MIPTVHIKTEAEKAGNFFLQEPSSNQSYFNALEVRKKNKSSQPAIS